MVQVEGATIQKLKEHLEIIEEEKKVLQVCNLNQIHKSIILY